MWQQTPVEYWKGGRQSGSLEVGPKMMDDEIREMVLAVKTCKKFGVGMASKMIHHRVIIIFVLLIEHASSDY